MDGEVARLERTRLKLLHSIGIYLHLKIECFECLLSVAAHRSSVGCGRVAARETLCAPIFHRRVPVRSARRGNLVAKDVAPSRVCWKMFVYFLVIDINMF